MNLESAIKQLYDQEINCGLETFWDGGVTAWIGDNMNGKKAEYVFGIHQLGYIAGWLLAEAKSLSKPKTPNMREQGIDSVKLTPPQSDVQEIRYTWIIKRKWWEFWKPKWLYVASPYSSEQKDT